MERETEDQPGKSPGFPYTPPPPNQRRFYHDVQWDIADIRMLLGSDLPIFGSDSHPAISLRLRDMRRPITVLTGLDYWLDNLMCNVPELAMCFHLDGIVQRYEMVKTEDIPNLENSEFSPKEVLEVAQNILAFLKANCTREGHTYWLFRQRGEEVVKLYDITSLMETSSRDEEEGGKAQNPFARSVAVLFYRVARNMLNPPGSSSGSNRLSSAVTGEELSMAKLLLENCVRLLRDSRHSDDINVGSSACYLLADLYLSRSPSDSTPSPDGPPDIRGRSRDRKLSLNSDGGETEGREGVGGPLSYLDSKSLSVRDLRDGHLTFPRDPTHPLPSLLVTSSTDRARLALQSIAKGLDILGESLFVPRSPATSETPLAHTCGSHLLQKAGSAYLCLARTCTKTGKHGRALRYTRCALLCFRGSRECAGDGGSGGELLDHLLSWQQCGDLHCLLSRVSCSSDFEDFWLENPEDTPLVATATRLHPPEPDSKEEACLTIHSNRETSLWRSIDCYEKALQLAPSVRLSEAQSSGVLLTLRTHFGSVWNELGTHYMVTASSLDYAKERGKVEKLWNCSHACLNRGLDLFTAADSTSTSVNRSSTYANLGCLMRACASVHSRLAEAQGSEFTSEEKAYYEKSLEYYTTAQQLLRHERVEPEFWSSLMCDLGLMYNTLARHLLDRPPLSKLTPVEVERKVMDSLLRSLHCIEPQLSAVDINSPRFPVIHQLAGESHYRLGCLYQKTACGRSSSCSAQKLKHSRSQAEKHFNKAFQYYLPEHHAKEILRLLLDKSTLFELQAQQGQGVRLQLKLLESALSSLLQCQTALCHYQPCHEHETQPVESQQETKEEVEEGRRSEERPESGGDALTSLLLTRLLAVLKQLVSTAMKKSC
ncbi:Erythroid differentiation-related factor 1 [Geodia barretti]|uniref:Erythroid differentiation-related factor 1 n=1 Tax=Geodia barretti TaxID=519541 RepID=A0AA35WUM6_GEOBA|nr:Erythroid differentiation-related factor 1 [Geodia barretti]